MAGGKWHVAGGVLQSVVSRWQVACGPTVLGPTASTENKQENQYRGKEDTE